MGEFSLGINRISNVTLAFGILLAIYIHINEYTCIKRGRLKSEPFVISLEANYFGVQSRGSPFAKIIDNIYQTRVDLFLIGKTNSVSHFQILLVVYSFEECRIWTALVRLADTWQLFLYVCT